jgi:hypothetical protein
MTTIH